MESVYLASASSDLKHLLCDQRVQIRSRHFPKATGLDKRQPWTTIPGVQHDDEQVRLQGRLLAQVWLSIMSVLRGNAVCKM